MQYDHALVDALLFGKLEGVPEETQFLFARTGLVHLFSASGFHLWAAALVADFLARPLLPFLKSPRAREGTRFTSRLLLMIFFGNATGWSSPMLRAFVFAALSSGGKALELEPRRPWLFLISLVVSASLGKGSTLSFLLSAFGMAGILFVQPRKAWAISLGPWLFTLPICLWCFGLFPLLAPLWNLTFGLAVSWVVLPTAIVSLIANSAGCPLPSLDHLNALTMNTLVSWLECAANFAGGTYWVRPIPCVVLSVGLGMAALYWKKRRLSLALAATCLALTYSIPTPSLSVLDVGQGDGILVKTENALTLVDVGPSGFEGGSAPVSRALEALATGTIDQVMLSHFDMDHRGGLSSLMARHKVRHALWFRETDLAAAHSEDVVAAAERASVPIRFISREHSPPDLQCWLAPFEKGNDSSPLCRAFPSGGASVLLTGDMSEKAETWFALNLNPFPTATILKVAHHGSRTSSSEIFLRASEPKIGLISVGLRNRYGHPTEETLARLTEHGISIRRTDQEGTLSAYPWRRIFFYLSLGFFTDEIIRPPPKSLVKPGSPAWDNRT